jgi:hypothetical protein
MTQRRTRRPRDQRPVAGRSPVSAGGRLPGREIARLRAFQHNPSVSPERPAPLTLKVALERRPTYGGPVSGSAERVSIHVPGERRNERSTNGQPAALTAEWRRRT